MHVRFWGVRGSIPVSGKAYTRFGGDSACLEVRGSRGSVIIDAGTGLRGLGNALLAGEPQPIHLLLTHFHWDHILGLLFFKPLYDDRFRITIHGPLPAEETEATLAALMRQPYFPVPFASVQARLSFAHLREAETVDGFNVEAIPLSHSSPGQGYALEDESGRLVFLTDNELDGEPALDRYAAFAQNASLLVHDAEYTESEYAFRKGWGHSSQERALDLALRAGARRLALYHHNQDRTDAEILAMERQCREKAALAAPVLDCFAAAQGMEVTF
jgi:phosphoribosyl 1,2-cyclic phosphodiesterase